MKPVSVLLFFAAGCTASTIAQNGPSAVKPAAPAAPSAAAPTHFISGEAAAALVAERPKFDPTAAAKDPTPPPATTETVGAAIHLPAQIVTTGKLPPLDERSLYGKEELKDLARRRYGTAADRNLAENHPFLSRLLSLHASTDDRDSYMQMYEDDERLQHIDATSRIVESTQAAGDKSGAADLAREAQQTYARRYDFGRVNFRK